MKNSPSLLTLAAATTLFLSDSPLEGSMAKYDHVGDSTEAGSIGADSPALHTQKDIENEKHIHMVDFDRNTISGVLEITAEGQYQIVNENGKATPIDLESLSVSHLYQK